MAVVGRDTIVGVIPSMTTPFDENEDVDFGAFQGELEYLLDLGVSGLAVGGSTGEGFALTCEELSALWSHAAREIGGRVPLVAGVITTHSREAKKRAVAASAAGADCLMVTPPIYNHPSPRGIYDFYESIWEAAGLPIIIYNVVRHIPITPSILRDLVEIPGIVAHKESIGGGLEPLSEMLETVGDQISVTWAHDPLLFLGCALGARASISGICTVLPGHCKEMFEAVERNDLLGAREVHFRLQPLMRAFGTDNWAPKTKAALRFQGREVGPARRPLVPPTDADLRAIREALIVAGSLQLSD